jgi:hypothetical protein
LDGTSECEEWFEGGRRIVYKESVVGWEDFLFFSLYSFSCIAKQVTTLKQLRPLTYFDSLETNIEPLVLFFDITLVLPISLTLDPAHYSSQTQESSV